MVIAIRYDEARNAVDLFGFIFAEDAERYVELLPDKYKFVVRSKEDIQRQGIPPLILRKIYKRAFGKDLILRDRKVAERKVFTAMSKLTKEEAKAVAAAAKNETPKPVTTTTVDPSVAEKAAAEKAAKAAEAEAKKQAKAEEKAKREESRKAAKELKAKEAAERKAQREADRAARAANKTAGPVDCPHTAVIKVVKTSDQFPAFKGKRAEIVKQLKDGITVGEFIKAVRPHDGGVGDVRIYLEKGMIELVKVAAPAPAETPTPAPAETPAQ